ncbi:MAG: hypothetical protein KDH92_13515, partial [Chloroflexi bacterium]|nr:hypothetical protein [Chloroflexota bacterium]
MSSLDEAFESLDYAPAPESDAAARAWIAASGPDFDHWVDGRRMPPAAGERLEVFNPADGQPLARV